MHFIIMVMVMITLMMMMMMMMMQGLSGGSLSTVVMLVHTSHCHRFASCNFFNNYKATE